MNDFDAIMDEFESTMEEFEETFAEFEKEMQQYHEILGKTDSQTEYDRVMNAYRDDTVTVRAGAD